MTKIEKAKRIIIVVLIISVITIILLLLKNCSYKQINNENANETTKALDFTPSDSKETDSISIPGMDGISFIAEELKQNVDFYNPDKNKCYFIMELYLSDGTLLWKSNHVKPAEHIKNIVLARKLKKGTYKNCKLLYKCFSIESKTPLNNGEVMLTINST